MPMAHMLHDHMACPCAGALHRVPSPMVLSRQLPTVARCRWHTVQHPDRFLSSVIMMSPVRFRLRRFRFSRPSHSHHCDFTQDPTRQLHLMQLLSQKHTRKMLNTPLLPLKHTAAIGYIHPVYTRAHLCEFLFCVVWQLGKSRPRPIRAWSVPRERMLLIAPCPPSRAPRD